MKVCHVPRLYHITTQGFSREVTASSYCTSHCNDLYSFGVTVLNRGGSRGDRVTKSTSP